MSNVDISSKIVNIQENDKCRMCWMCSRIIKEAIVTEKDSWKNEVSGSQMIESFKNDLKEEEVINYV